MPQEEVHREWTVAYKDPHPYMDGPRVIRLGTYPTYERARAARDLLVSRSEHSPKQDNRIESRLVADWERED
jgi:hypothetical protein